MADTKTINEFGIRQDTFDLITGAFRRFPEIRKAIIFGSRAKKKYDNGSDIDIALAGETVGFDTIVRLSGLLNEELPIPHHIDLVDLTHLKHQKLKEHIGRVGKIIYEA